MEKVLIIIDEDKMRELYVKFFVSAGCIVRQASDLLNGLSLLMEEKMDLVLLDIKMSKQDIRLIVDIIQTHDPSLKVLVTSTYSADKQDEFMPQAENYIEKFEAQHV